MGLTLVQQSTGRQIRHDTGNGQAVKHAQEADR